MLPNPNNNRFSISSIRAGCIAAVRLAYSRLKRNTTSDMYATYAEQNGLVVNLDSEYDPVLLALYQKADFSKSPFDECNPPSEKETRMFAQYSYFDLHFIDTMLQRSARLPSKLFIKNISAQENIPIFPADKILKILDVGCGVPFSLPGVIAYFGGEDKVDYLGIDINS